MTPRLPRRLLQRMYADVQGGMELPGGILVAHEETLYRSPGGDFFVVTGEPDSGYAGMRLLDYDGAIRWLELTEATEEEYSAAEMNIRDG